MVSGGALVVGGGSICGDLGVLSLVMDFREVMLTSPPELAHCGGGWVCGATNRKLPRVGQMT